MKIYPEVEMDTSGSYDYSGERAQILPNDIQIHF